MKRNYWQEYWDNYWKFMAVYLRELQEAFPNIDIKSEYTEVANLFEPSMPYEDLENYNDNNNYSQPNSNQPSTSPNNGEEFIYPSTMPNNEGQSIDPSISPAIGQISAPFILPGGTPFISPGGGQFTINNCRRMAIVRIVMRRGFNPSEFFMAVDRADNRSIQGFRIDCQGGRIRFVPMAVEYRNINLIECAI